MAAIGFFGLAFVGFFSGVPVLVCSLRALLGAAALYVLVNLAGTAAIRILLDAAFKAKSDRPDAGNE